MITDDGVQRALAELSKVEASRHAPPHVERAVLDAFDRHRQRGASRRGSIRTYRRAAIAAVLAAAVAVATYLVVVDRAALRFPPDPFVQAPTPRSEVPAASERLDARNPVVPPPRTATRASPPAPARETRRVQPIIDAPAAPASDEFVHSVRVRVPRSLLPTLGVPVIDPDAEGTVNLEVLVAEDGVGTTIRVVR